LQHTQKQQTKVETTERRQDLLTDSTSTVSMSRTHPWTAAAQVDVVQCPDVTAQCHWLL